jgi:leucyl aminopeptidase
MISSALVLAVALGGSAAAGDSWITIDRDVLIAFETGAEPAAAGAIGALEDPLQVRPDVIAAPMEEDRLLELTRFIHERYRRCGGYVWHASREEAHAAAARAAQAAEMEAAAPAVPYTIDNGPVANALASAVQEAPIRNTITTLAAYFTRHHNCATGNQSALWIRDTWQALATAAGRSDVTVRLFNHTGYTTQQPSVILTIPGTAPPPVRDEFIVLGAHQDSIAGSNCSTSRSPGADDDASGVATLTEIIRVAMQQGFRPERTVEFMAYAAEEVGLRGSNQIAQQYGTVPVNVIGVLQFDMTNYQPANYPHDIVVYTDFTTIAQNDFVQQLAAAYVPRVGTFAPRPTSQCGYGCSDHAAWFNRGYAASFPFEAPFNQHNPFIHTSNDTLAQSGGHAHRTVPFARLGAVYMAELAKGVLQPLAPAQGAPAAAARPRARGAETLRRGRR